MKKLILPLLFVAAAMTSCSEEKDSSESNHEEPNELVNVEEVEAEEIVTAPTVGEFILGTWAKIGQGCDETGNNCEETPDASDWIFSSDSVSLGRISQPYTISGDTILIAESPYMISSEMSDTIILHGMNADRYMKMVRK